MMVTLDMIHIVPAMIPWCCSDALELNISTAVKWIIIPFGTDIHDLHK